MNERAETILDGLAANGFDVRGGCAPKVPPRVEFRLDEPDYVSIRHQHGRARINPAALELRPAGQRFQLHVLHIKRCCHDCTPGASRGVYLTMTAEEAKQARAVGIRLREKPKLPRTWKSGILTTATEAGEEEVLASVRRCYAIHKVSVTHQSSYRDYETGEERPCEWTVAAYRLTHIPSGKTVWTAKRRTSCEALADELEERIPELATLTDQFPPEILQRFNDLAETWANNNR